jgi:hypothetical protein
MDKNGKINARLCDENKKLVVGLQALAAFMIETAFHFYFYYCRRRGSL